MEFPKYDDFMERKVFRLDDSVISQISRLLQIAILTGTDISDHMRQIVLEPGTRKGHLVLTPEYKDNDAKVIDKMFDELEEMMKKNPDLKQ